MRLGGSGAAFRPAGPMVPPPHRPYQDLWSVVSLGMFIESASCTTVEAVLTAVARMDRTQPVLVSYLGRPAHIETPLGDGAWDGE